MSSPSTNEAVIEAVKAINRAWLDGQLEELAARIDEEIVLVTPGFHESIRGRESYVAGHREFLESAAIEHFRELDWHVDLLGDTAVVTYRYEMEYERSGQSCFSAGRDMFVLRHRSGGWQAIWRTMLDVEERAT